MWRDVCLANGAALRRELALYRTELERIEALIARGDGNGLLRLFESARRARESWLERTGGGDPA